MRLYSSVSILAICVAVVAVRYRDTIWQSLLPDREMAVAVDNLPLERRTALMADQTAVCLREMAGQGGMAESFRASTFCGCKVEALASFLNPNEFATGSFASPQRYVDHKWNVQNIVTKCAREAMISL